MILIWMYLQLMHRMRTWWEQRVSAASLRDVNQYLVSGVLGKVMGSFNHTLSIYYGNESAQQQVGKNNAQQFS
jgi:hypothetical protein